MTETLSTITYRKQAEQLRVLAQRADEASRKAELLAMAQEFEKLADFAEHNSAAPERD